VEPGLSSEWVYDTATDASGKRHIPASACQKVRVKAEDTTIYPDIDLLFDPKFEGYTHKDGRLYPK
jgi:hypothetical protein